MEWVSAVEKRNGLDNVGIDKSPGNKDKVICPSLVDKREMAGVHVSIQDHIQCQHQRSTPEYKRVSNRKKSR
jgi:hypothetical protein